MQNVLGPSAINEKNADARAPNTPTSLPSFLHSPPTANREGMEDWVLTIRADEAASANLEIR